MELGIFCRGHLDIPETLKKSPLDFVACGDYGCSNIIPPTKDIIALKNGMDMGKIKIHYISPKVNQAVIDEEYHRVAELMDEGISISINDWGLLYKLKERISNETDVYLGRLLTKSVFNWAWSNMAFAKEDCAAVEYLSQNNFNHQQKIAYFKEWHIKGIEANMYLEGEVGYQRIKELGMEIIGYADHMILAVARACPTARMNGVNFYTNPCPKFCRTQSFSIVPAEERQKTIYPQMELCGNTLYKPKDIAVSWYGYQKVVFNWRLGKEEQINEQINRFKVGASQKLSLGTGR